MGLGHGLAGKRAVEGIDAATESLIVLDGLRKTLRGEIEDVPLASKHEVAETILDRVSQLMEPSE